MRICLASRARKTFFTKRQRWRDKGRNARRKNGRKSRLIPRTFAKTRRSYIYNTEKSDPNRLRTYLWSAAASTKTKAERALARRTAATLARRLGMQDAAHALLSLSGTNAVDLSAPTLLVEQPVAHSERAAEAAPLSRRGNASTFFKKRKAAHPNPRNMVRTAEHYAATPRRRPVRRDAPHHLINKIVLCYASASIKLVAMTNLCLDIDPETKRRLQEGLLRCASLSTDRERIAHYVALAVREGMCDSWIFRATLLDKAFFPAGQAWKNRWRRLCGMRCNTTRAYATAYKAQRASIDSDVPQLDEKIMPVCLLEADREHRLAHLYDSITVDSMERLLLGIAD